MKPWSVSWLVAGSLLSLALAAAANEPSVPAPVELLGADLAPGLAERGSFPTQLTGFGDRVLFRARDPRHGEELWSSDGTEAGTHRVLDSCPGPCSGAVGQPAVIGERFFFVALEGGRLSLWVGERGSSGSTGSAGGRETVRRVALFDSFAQATVQQLTPLGDRAVFAGSDAEHGVEPWISDGTPGGTRRLADLCTEPGCSSFPSELVAVGGSVYFSARDPEHGEELFVTDGTSAGTRLAADICPGACDSLAVNLFPWRGRVWFAAFRPAEGLELWSAAPGEGARREGDLEPGAESSFPSDFFVWRDRLYFRALSGSGGTWYRIDHPGAPPVVAAELQGLQDFLFGFTVVGEALHFLSVGDEGADLWVLDGAGDGSGSVPRHLAALAGGARPLGSVGGTVLYAELAPGEATLWRTDGTVAGTVAIRGFDSLLSLPGAVAGGRLLFGADGDDTGVELWRVGAAGAPVRVANLAHDEASSSPFALTPLGDGVAFLAGDDLRGEGSPLEGALWRAAEAQDGLGVERLSDQDDFSELVPFSESVAAVRYGELWRFAADGARALLYDGQHPEDLAAAGATLFFSTYGQGQEVWASDGTPDGTRLVVDADPTWSDECPILCPGQETYPRQLTALGSRAVFVAYAGDPVQERLWVSDGSAIGGSGSGTHPIDDDGAFEGEPTIRFDRLTAVGETLFFIAWRRAEWPGETHRTVWRWRPDGGAPEPVADLAPVPGTASLPLLAAVGDRLVFVQPAANEPPSAPGGDHDEIWAVGEAGPAVRIGPVDGPPSFVREIGALGSRALLSVLSRDRGDEPWVVDGGTITPLGDLAPGSLSARPSGFVTVGACSLFSASGQGLGDELWITDGAPAGTRPVLDLAPGEAASGPSWITVAGGLVYFSADDGAHGRELFAVPTAAVNDLCDGVPPGPWLEAPGLPGFRVKARFEAQGGAVVEGALAAGCLPETLCVSGALPDRIELFVRVVGPKPNGKLWPTLVRFSTSAIEVWIEQASTGTVRHYRLEGAAPGDDSLDGLFDRTGFDP